MESLFDSSISSTILIFSLVIALGLLLGRFSFMNIRLGCAGVLFSGILFGHFGVTVDQKILEFTRELGLILFVYTIGVQIGPGFIAAFRRNGLLLNLLAVFTVLVSFILAIFFYYFTDLSLPILVGILCGATTNTPSLATAQETLRDIPLATSLEITQPTLGYAVAYPFGILGIILTMIMIRYLFGIVLKEEEQEYLSLDTREPIERVEVLVENPNLQEVTINEIPLFKELGIVVSRILQNDQVIPAMGDSKIYVGDVLRIIGPSSQLKKAVMMVGKLSDIDLSQKPSNLQEERIMVTKGKIEGRTLFSLRPREKFRVTITKIIRGGLELSATPETELHLADVLVVVGDQDHITLFAQEVGNVPGDLKHPFVIPIFVGIAIGILIGNIPFYLPNVPFPVKLGLAGGPLIAAIGLSAIGRIGGLVWFLPTSATYMLQDLGIVFFMACVGLSAGDRFVETVVSGNGFYWMGIGIILTFVPIFLAGITARKFFGLNYLTICGLLPGSMTDPPALAFAKEMTTHNAPLVAYATVYPMVMVMRILSTQILILFFY